MPQNADGTPHLTYYDAERLLSFVWDGKSDVIEICHGGYGEPVVAVIPVHPLLRTLPANRLMVGFRAVCDRFVELHLPNLHPQPPAPAIA